MDNRQEHRTFVVAHISYAYLICTAAVHVITAYALALFAEQVAGIDPAYAFPPAYLALIALTSYLMLRNGRWAVDDQFIYKGWHLARFIAVSEIEHAQIGIPDNWITGLAQLPGAGTMGLAESVQKSALVLRLSGNRWLVWQFLGMVNRDRFVEAVLQLSQCKDGDALITKLPSRFPLLSVGKIIQA